MTTAHLKAPIVCAEQVEIFVPKNEAYLDKLKALLDNLIFQDKIPFVEQEHKFWLRRVVEDYNAVTKKHLSFAEKEYWENLIFGYSIYDSEGYFVGPDAQLRRSRDNYFEEPTAVIKLIVTNYLTPGVNYPVVHSAENPFWHTPQWFVSQPISPYRSQETDSAAGIRFEYSTMMLHYWGIIAYLFDQLSHEVMLNEQEIWIQRWHTQLSRRIQPDVRYMPIATSEAEKRQKFGKEEYHKVLCVIDYINQR